MYDCSVPPGESHLVTNTMGLVPVKYGSETIWKEKDRARIRALQMDNLRGLIGIQRIGRVQNVQVRKLCRVMK